MSQPFGNGLKIYASRRLVLTFLAITAILAAPVSGGQGGQDDKATPCASEGALLYRSPSSGRYENVPLVHTDVALDVRGLVAAATVTQQYVNSSTEPIEAVYIFPLPHDAAVYDMEIRIGNRLIRSVIREREEAKRVYEAAKSEGKRAALVEEERPNIFTASVANLMPGDHVDVRLRYVQPLLWEDGRVRLVFPMVVGPRYIPGTQAVGHNGTGWALDTNAVPDASRITPIVQHLGGRLHQIHFP
jgi:Ca-activated chloride channel family protein